jgi:hypothetical protein
MPGSWSWSDAWQFIGLFVGIRIIFIWLATKLFIGMIPDGDACPMCDDRTLPLERNGWWRLLGRRFRRSWCLQCGWEGVLRCAPGQPAIVSPITNRRSQAGQLPLISKKSSK